MITSKGVCSVTFRKFSAKIILLITKKSRLSAIEWGGDIHVPAGDIKTAEKVKKLTEKKGLEVFSYGSYFRCDDVEKFKRVSETAQALGASVIRVWAGQKDAEKFSEQEFSSLVSTVRECCKIAEARGQIIAFEFHGHTYNNSAENAQKLLAEIDDDTVKTYWQPTYWRAFQNDEERIEYNKKSIELLRDKIICVHVYHWLCRKKLPLSQGKEEWKMYTKLLPDCHGYLEFVRANRIMQFLSDAKSFLEL